MGRYPPPGYEEDPNASPAYDEEKDAPDYEDERYVSEDPYAQRQEEAEETEESLIAMHQRELDVQRNDDDGAEEAEEREDWLDEEADPEEVRRQNAEMESGYEREREDVETAYRADEGEEKEEVGTDHRDDESERE